MYSNKENVNILTALLVAHGVKYAVVCPGSRNAPIVHNLQACPSVQCFPVTDERSAGFYALGLAQATDAPVVVCVTSGSALLNLLPAVAEAHYQHQALIVVSADRPAAWIDQLDGQTLVQPGALGALVARCVTLPEPHNETERWHCNRLVNEALLCAFAGSDGEWRDCVHINVPISEPLFGFTTPALPSERVITRFMPAVDYDCLRADFVDDVARAERPMIVFGQATPHLFSGNEADFLYSHAVVLHEALAPFASISHFDEVLHAAGQDASLQPDVVIYVGDAVVSKRLKAFLRQAWQAHVWRISPVGSVEDTFMHLRGVVTGDAESVLRALSHKLVRRWDRVKGFRRQWLSWLRLASSYAAQHQPAYSQMAAVQQFERQWARMGGVGVVHYANSTAIRLANIYAAHHVWCNRGVNGIEGSLSTACGFSLVNDDLVCCVTGDLSFFYDQNALWNQNLRGNMRILLLNNGKGGIFDLLSGLEQSEARDRLVAASHQTTAEGICMENNVGYRAVDGADALNEGMAWLLAGPSERPRLLEVRTSSQADEQAYREYYRGFVDYVMIKKQLGTID